MISPEEASRELAAATGQLLGDLEGLSDAQVAGPSLLPGWTRGHVLTHLARNAEGGTRLLGWARTGVPSYEYESLEARAAAIEAGADRPAATLIQDVRQTAGAFAAAAAEMPPEAWQRVVRYTAGQEPRADVIVPSRLAEVLIHHVDLDLRYRPRDWPAWFANDMLSSTAAALGEGRTMTPPVRLAGTDTGNVFVIGAVGPRTRVDGVAIRPIRRPSAVPVGQGPRAIAITPDGRTAYVASWQGGTVTPIATATNTAGTPIEVGEGARAIAVTP